MRHPVFYIKQIYFQVPALPDTLFEIIPMDLSIQQKETLSDLLYVVPRAMRTLLNLSLNSSLSSNNDQFDSPIIKGIQMLCNVVSELHCSMDFVYCVESNMQIMLADVGHQILTEMDDETDDRSNASSTRLCEMFEISMNCLQVASGVAAQKIAFNENRIKAILAYWSLLLERLLQKKHDTKVTLDQLEIERENIAIQNAVSQMKQTELREREEKINRSILETNNQFHAAISEVRCDKTLLAVDVGVELTLDVLFTLIPFMKAVQFVDKAVVVGRFLLRKVTTLTPAIHRAFLRIFRKNQVASETEDTPEDKHRVYTRCDTLQDYVDDFNSFIDDGKLAPSINLHRLTELKWKLTTFLNDVHNLPECRTLHVLMTICLCGLSICESLQVLECEIVNFTTPEDDQIVHEIQK